jgi:putative restriction endonuclease
MLKSPIRKIGGYGNFLRYADMNASQAWAHYGTANGTASREELVKKIERFAEKRSKGYISTGNPLIGCIELSDVITLDEERFVRPEDLGYPFPNQVVKLKYFKGQDDLAAHLGGQVPPASSFALVTGTPSRKPTHVKERKGQSEFRDEILRNYGHRCCVTAEALVPLLEAAHIQPYIDTSSNHAQNGLCLRVDIHRLLDEGLISITEEGTVATSKRLAGTSYAALNGVVVRAPTNKHSHPSKDALKFHRTEVFR